MLTTTRWACIFLATWLPATFTTGDLPPLHQTKPEEKEMARWQEVPWSEAFVLEGKHYRVQSNTSKEVTQAYLDLLESAHPALVDLFEGIPSEPPEKLADVFILASGDDFRTLRGKTKIAGFYTSSGSPGIPARTIVTYHGAKMGAAVGTEAVLLHHAAMQFAHVVVPELWNVPVWLAMGTATLFETSRIEIGTVILRDEKTSQVGVVRRDILSPLQGGIEAGKGGYIPLKQLIRTPQPAYGRYHVAHAWSLVHWMWNGDGGKHRPIFVDLWKTAQERSIKPDEVETVIRNATGHDIDEFEEKVWKPYVLGLVPEPTGDVKGDQFTSRTMKLKVSRPGPGWDWVVDDLPVVLQVRMAKPEVDAKIDVSATLNEVSPTDLREKGLDGLFEDVVEGVLDNVGAETGHFCDLDECPDADEFFQKIKVSGRKAVRFAYTAPEREEDPKKAAVAKILVIIPTVRRRYEIRCECPPDEIEALQADFDKVIRSFQIE